MVKNQRSIKLLLSFLLFSQSILAEETSHVWTRIGPHGGSVLSFTVSPSFPDTVYAKVVSGITSREQQYLKSNNAGRTWVIVPFSQSSKKNPILEFGIDSTNPQILFARSHDSTQGILLKSTDGGMNWYQIATNIANIQAETFITLNTPFGQSLRVFVNIEGSKELGMAVSNDGGGTWTLTDKKISSMNNNTVHLIARDYTHADILYGSYFEGVGRTVLLARLYKSINAGVDWVDISPPNFRVRSVSATENSNKIYAKFIRDTPFKQFSMGSVNGGQSWEEFDMPISDNSMNFLLGEFFIDPTDSKILYSQLFSSDRGLDLKNIAKSIDSGTTWQVIDVSPYRPVSIAINSRNNQELLMATVSRGVVNSHNGGLDWHSSNTGMRFIGNKFITGEEGAVMYAFNGRFGAYQSLDVGKNWKDITFKIEDKDDTTGNGVACSDFILNPKNTKEIICRSYALFKSKDSGQHWALIYRVTHHQENWLSQAIYAADGQTIYTVHRGVNKGINKSVDNGVSWRLVSSLAGVLSAHPGNANILYNVANIDGSISLYKSINGGKDWKELIRSNHPFKHKLIMHPTNPERLVFNDGGREFLLTDDGGKSWKEILSPFNKENQNTAFPHVFTRISSLVFSPINLDGLVAITEKGTFESADLGEHWDKVNMRFNEKLPSYSELKSTLNTVYLVSAYSIFNLIKKPDNKKTSSCLFEWAEQQYPDIFSSALKPTHNWGGYNYRYYRATNTYLGLFHEQEVHMLQPNVSDTISTHGSVDFYLNLAQCNE